MPSASTGLHRQRLLPPALEAHLLGALGRFAGLVLLVVLTGLWASIVSWSLSDPSLTHVTSGGVRNMLGAPGAIVSDLLIQTLGAASAVALFPLMIWAFELVGAQHVAGARTKVTYYPLALLALAGAFAALPTSAAWPIEHGYGGILGDVIHDFVTAVLGVISSDTAGIAATILLLGIGLSSLVQAGGLTREHLPALPSLGRARARAAVEPSLGGWTAERDDRSRVRGGRSHSGFGLLAAWGGRDTSAPASHGHPVEPALPGGPAGPGWGASPGWQAYDADPRAAAGGASDFAHDGADDFAGEEAHDPDPALARSSRAIAERFAPAQGRVAAAESLPVLRPMPEPEAALPPDDLPRFMRGGAPRREAPAPAERLPPLVAHPLPSASPATPKAAPARRAAPPSILSAIARRAEPHFKRPSPAMLKRTAPSKAGTELSQTVLRGTARLLEDVLADFGVKGEVRDVKPGPVVTLFELEPARGTKATRIMALADDIARSMSATSARVALIPGRNVIGIELPNARREMVGLRELIESPVFASADGVLPLTLGRAIGGEPVVVDLARMPHLLVAGTTGSGKSVGVNAMILSILFRHTPDQCRFLMIDPKMLELSVYNDIPHLLTPVVTDPQKAVGALNWVVGEMEERYKRMAKLSVRNIEAFNTRVTAAREKGERLARTVQTGFDPATGKPLYEREEMDLAAMPYIVVVVDEFADLMITAGKDIETAVQRLAQKARAAGIHLIMATQRPSVDIITGTIKANFPTRISFKVASKIDSRTILNEQGAEQLLGQGDMLTTSGAGQMLRVHGPFVSDEEVEAVASYLRTQGAPRYIENLDAPAGDAGEGGASGGAGDDGDSLYDRAVAVVLRDRKASTSYVQRRLSIGYNRAADLIERMERDGLISAPSHTGRREILAGEGAARAAG